MVALKFIMISLTLALLELQEEKLAHADLICLGVACVGEIVVWTIVEHVDEMSTADFDHFEFAHFVVLALAPHVVGKVIQASEYLKACQRNLERIKSSE